MLAGYQHFVGPLQTNAVISLPQLSALQLEIIVSKLLPLFFDWMEFEGQWVSGSQCLQHRPLGALDYGCGISRY